MSEIEPTPEEVVAEAKRRLPISPEWVWRVAAACLLIANLWLGKNFVTRSEYDKMQEAVIALQKLVSNMEIRNEVNVIQNDTLKDHENRLRKLESTPAAGPRFRQPPTLD